MLRSHLKQAKSHLNIFKGEMNLKDEIDIEDEIEKCYSTTDDNNSLVDDIIEKDQDEEILIEIEKNQSTLTDYSSQGIGFSSRGMLFNWVEKVISLLGLEYKNQLSIYYRFTSIYDIIMGKMYIENNKISSDEELKKLIVTIFLISYKFEGHSVYPISINSLINAFLSEYKIDPILLTEEIHSMEIGVLRLLEYNVFSFNTNIHTLSSIMLNLIKNHFGLSDEIFQLIEGALPKLNHHILLSGNILFNNFPIDIAAISLSSTFNYIKKALSNEMEYRMSNENEAFDPYWIQLLIKDLSQLSNDLYSYLKNHLDIIKVPINYYEYFSFAFSEGLL